MLFSVFLTFITALPPLQSLNRIVLDLGQGFDTLAFCLCMGFKRMSPCVAHTEPKVRAILNEYPRAFDLESILSDAAKSRYKFPGAKTSYLRSITISEGLPRPRSGS